MTKTLSGEDSYRLLIGGEWVAGDAGAYPVVNPATEAVVGRGAGGVRRPGARRGRARRGTRSRAWSQTCTGGAGARSCRPRPTRVKARIKRLRARS